MCLCVYMHGLNFALSTLIGTSLIADNVGLLHKYRLLELFCV